VLLIGPVVPQLSTWLDRYWNARDVIPIGGVAAAADADTLRLGWLEKLRLFFLSLLAPESLL
jgi:hypothetical protein